MNAKHLLFLSVMLLFTGRTAIAQTTEHIRPIRKEIIPFGKKLPPPDPKDFPDRFLPENVTTGTNTRITPQSNTLNTTDIIQHPKRTRQQFLGNIDRKLEIKRSNALPHTNGENSNSKDLDFHLTKDINSLSGSAPHNNAELPPHSSYAILNDVMYFAANDAIHGAELWRSDGTEEGTYM